MNFHEKPITYVSEVQLKVLDLPGMVKFYQEMIGLDVLEQTATSATLGTEANPLLKLDQLADGEAKTGRYAGLYHFAILLPTREDLGRILIHLHQNGIRLGSSDHLVSEALYLSDPEGNGIEIYRDRASEEWQWQGDQVAMAVDPIDAEGIIADTEKEGTAWKGMPAGTVMGHIHLHVSDLAVAKRFYEEGLGFETLLNMGGQALFLGDGKYHHHIGLNVWNGVGVPALPENVAGLGSYTLMLASEEKRQTILQQLAALDVVVSEKDGVYETADPSGNRIILTV